MDRSERIYRALLRLYPRDFRDEYGVEMSSLFHARSRDGAVRLWLQVVGDLLLHAPREHWHILRQDVRFALRSWRRSPAVPFVALSALTLGMGANIAIFSVTHAVLLRPLPVREPERVLVAHETRAPEATGAGVSLPNYLSWAEGSRTLDLAAYSGQALTWTGNEHPERLDALSATASFLPVLGVPLQSGRWFRPDEERPGQHRVAVLSDRLWRTRFAADADVLGRRLMMNGAAYTVIGVASAELSVPSEPDLWVPQVVDAATARRNNRYLAVVARLKPGTTLGQARADMTSLAAALEREFPDSNRGFGITLVPLEQAAVPLETRTTLIVLLLASAIVLLIACANVANVLLSRAAGRVREIAIRAALGAGAVRIARQLLTEAMLLSCAGGLLGIGVSVAIVTSARRMLADIVPRAEEAGLNGPVFAFAMTVAILTGIAFGLAPLWHVRRAGGDGLFHPAGRDDRLPSRNRARGMLVVAQVALTTLLLVGAGLLVQSLVRLQQVATGINAESVVTAKLSLVRARLPNGAAIAAFLARLTDDLERTRGVEVAGVSSAIPLSPGAYTITNVAAETEPVVSCQWRLVDAGYFRALQIPILRGRTFSSQDVAESPRVFVISQQTARALFGESDPIGRRLRLENGNSGEVVGVVADVRMRNLGEPPERVVYFPPSQFGFFPLFNVVVRTPLQPDQAAAVIRDRLKALDGNLAAYEVQSMQHWVDRNSATMRVRTALMSALGVVALLLGVVGVYGVMSYLVSLRMREFGIRTALGAPPWAIPVSIVRRTAIYAATGTALGFAAALPLVDRMRGLLYGIDPKDPGTFAGVAAIVVFVALAASVVPARRAARTEVLIVLRTE
jgi:putative ABC transport system permease protein